MPKKHPRLQSFAYAWQGLKTLFATQPNARLQAGAALLACLGGVALNINILEWALLAFSMAAVLAAEAFNTAVEKLGDAVTLKPNALVGQAKDLAAAGVLLASLGALAAGLLVFVPKIML